MEADITANFKYDFDVVNLALMTNMYFNNDSNSDFFLSTEISRDFITNNNKFQISPAAGIYFGSQNFYEQYYIYNRFGNGNRKGSGQNNGQGQGTGGNSNQTTTTITEVVLEDSEKFNIMAIEFSVPIWYAKNHFTVLFLPAFVIPKTPAILIVDGVTYKEDLENSFYWVAGFSYKL